MYWPAKPRLLASATVPRMTAISAPSELVMRVS